MKLRYVYLKQLFEEGGDGATGAEGGTGTEGTKGGTDTGAEGGQGGAGGEPEKKYTDNDIDRIINKKFAEWQKKQQKAVDEATRLANMTAQEKAEHERDEMEKKYNELLRQNTVAQLNVQARKILSEGGISNIPDEIVSVLVAEDAEKTKANVDAFSKMFKEAVQEAVKTANKKPSPRTGSGSTLTKADIMKVEDINERQRLIRENYDLFKH